MILIYVFESLKWASLGLFDSSHTNIRLYKKKGMKHNIYIKPGQV